MTSPFGDCLAGDTYHSLCEREFTDTYGVVHRCGCAGHDFNGGTA